MPYYLLRGCCIRVASILTLLPRSTYVTHEVISEYSVGPLKNSDSQNLFEFSQVVSVDGKAVRSLNRRAAN